MNRRGFIFLSTLAWPCAALANLVSENPIDGMKRWGSAKFRRWGFVIYEATLWAGDDPTKPPLALKLTYNHNIASKDIVAVSIDEMRQLGIADETQLAQWRAQLENILPNVRTNDHILGLYLESGAQFFHNEKFIGAIENATFARAFFGIWLDAKTSAPELRNALLLRGIS